MKAPARYLRIRLLLFSLLLPLVVGCGGSGTDASVNSGTVPVNEGTGNVSVATGVIESGWYQPPLNVTWQWQLKGNINTGYPVEIYDIDLFDSSEHLIDTLHSSGRKVICYFSAGSYEDWRPDAAEFSRDDIGNTLEGWEDEKWLDIRSPDVRRIMQQRLDLARQKGCDGVEPDNVDGYANDSGFDLSPADQLTYNRFIAGEAHKRGLSVGLKNDLDQVEQLVGFFDFSVNEQCYEFEECDRLLPFIEAGKPVLNVEYEESLIRNEPERQSLCYTANEKDFSTLILPVDLDDSFRFSCK
ncbi:MAG: endo alpha-1,4 polygalactosaminidase [Thermoleophilia bacterium]